jgi:hypothetical protein
MLTSRMAEFPKISARGRTMLLVPTASVESWSAEHAKRRLEEAAGEWPGRAAILALSDSTLGPDDSLPRAIGHLAGAFERGSLLALRVPDDAATMQPGQPGDVDWDDIPRISDLLRRDGGDPLSRTPAEPGGSDGERRDPGSGSGSDSGGRGSGEVPGDTWTSFVAFAVFDQDGRPLHGRSRCDVDGEVAARELVGEVVEVRPISATARVELVLEGLRGVEE